MIEFDPEKVEKFDPANWYWDEPGDEVVMASDYDSLLNLYREAAALQSAAINIAIASTERAASTDNK